MSMKSAAAATQETAVQRCPKFGRRFHETTSPGGWCTTCDHCEQGFAEGDVVRRVRVTDRGRQQHLYIHRCCWAGWNRDRLATVKASAEGLRLWANTPLQIGGAQ